MNETTIINRADGTVEGHRAGCRDIARSISRDGYFGDDSPWTAAFTSKRDAFLAYNADFIAEADGDEGNTWPIRWLPCADFLPETHDIRCGNAPDGGTDNHVCTPDAERAARDARIEAHIAQYGPNPT